MRVVALEEHFTVPAVASKYVKPDAIAKRGHFKARKRRAGQAPARWSCCPRSARSGSSRWTTPASPCRCCRTAAPAPISCPAPDGVALAREMNDHLAGVVAKHPKRFAGFAVAADGEPRRLRRRAAARGEGPEASSARMIHGTTEGRFLDHPSYDGLLAAAVELDVPIYIHPQRADAGACGRPTTPDLPEGADRVVGTAGWGWHSEVAIHILRMVLAGTLRQASASSR